MFSPSTQAPFLRKLPPFPLCCAPRTRRHRLQTATFCVSPSLSELSQPEIRVIGFWPTHFLHPAKFKPLEPTARKSLARSPLLDQLAPFHTSVAWKPGCTGVVGDSLERSKQHFYRTTSKKSALVWLNAAVQQIIRVETTWQLQSEIKITRSSPTELQVIP